MRLDPVAKPVKIRIKLGDCECTDLEKAKENFSLKEIYPLYKDGRLSRWLKQIGHDELAKLANDGLTNGSGHDDVLVDYISVIQIFFPDAKDIIDSIDNESGDYFGNLFKITRELVATYLSNTKFPVCDILDTWCPLVLKERDRSDLVAQLSSCIDSQEKFRIVFKYLMDYVSRDEDNAELLTLLLGEMTPKGYDWKECLVNDLNTDILRRLFDIKSFRETIADWGELFASHMSNYDNESNIVEPLLFSAYGDNELSQYHKILEDRGLVHPVIIQPQNIQSQNICFFDFDVKGLSDLPLINQLLKDTQEFEKLLATINSWLSFRKRYSGPEHAISDSKRSNIVFKHEASKQIVGFVKGILLLEQNSNNKFLIYSASRDLFADVKSVLNIMQSRKYTSQKYQFTKAQNCELNVIERKSSYLKDCVKDARSKSYGEVAYGIVNDLLNKLKESSKFVQEIEIPFEELLHNNEERDRVIKLISNWSAYHRGGSIISAQIKVYQSINTNNEKNLRLSASKQINSFLLNMAELEKNANKTIPEDGMFGNVSAILNLVAQKRWCQSFGRKEFNDSQKTKLYNIKRRASIFDIQKYVDFADTDTGTVRSLANRIVMDLENMLIETK